nr:SDR family oxidoreductase [Microbacterium sp. BR1]
MSLDLRGRRALVTGSTRGLGFAMAARLAEAGACVGVNGRSVDSVESALEKLRELVPNAEFDGVVADLVSIDAARAVERQFPNIDILVNNVGVYQVGDALSTSDQVWADHFDTNVLTGVRMTQVALPGMLERGWGRILFIASDAAVSVPKDMVHYSASKTALLAVARGFAKATAGSSVTVNSVIVGPSESEGLRTFAAGLVGDELPWGEAQAAFMREHRPLSLIQRVIRPQEVANMIVYLSSDLASATTGGAIRVDGGYVDAITP